MKTIGLDWDLALKKSLTLSKGKTENEQDAGLLMLISLHTGLRKGDLLSLTKSQFQNGMLVGIAQKTKKEYSFPLPEWLINKALSNSNHKDTILNNLRSHIFLNRWVHRTFNDELCKTSKNRTISVHSLRKAFGMRMYDRFGVNSASQALQHNNITTTMDYLEIPEKELSNQIKSLWS